MNYKEKYLKYVKKYLELSGGALSNLTSKESERLKTLMLVLNRKNKQANEKMSRGQKPETKYLPPEMTDYIRKSYVSDFDENQQFIKLKFN